MEASLVQQEARFHPLEGDKDSSNKEHNSFCTKGRSVYLIRATIPPLGRRTFCPVGRTIPPVERGGSFSLIGRTIPPVGKGANLSHSDEGAMLLPF